VGASTSHNPMGLHGLNLASIYEHHGHFLLDIFQFVDDDRIHILIDAIVIYPLQLKYIDK
jgi:hypothetical protein